MICRVSPSCSKSAVQLLVDVLMSSNSSIACVLSALYLFTALGIAASLTALLKIIVMVTPLGLSVDPFKNDTSRGVKEIRALLSIFIAIR